MGRRNGSGAAREAARRAARAAVQRPGWDVRLPALRRELDALDERRRLLVRERAALVAEAREAGATWPALESMAGVSRPALLKTLREP